MLKEASEIRFNSLENSFELELFGKDSTLYSLISESSIPLVEGHRWKSLTTPRGRVYGSSKLRGSKTSVLLHRYLLSESVSIPGEGYQVDHINSNSLDNRLENLRWVTPSQNNSNARLRCNNELGFKGVSFSKRSSSTKPIFVTRIMLSGKGVTVGRFSTAEEAAIAYDEAARKYFGVHCRLNFPGPGELGCR